GDPAQAIYGFAGADAAPLVEFTRYFPAGTVIALDRNYRSTPQIVGVAESVLRGDGSLEREVVAVRPTGPAPHVRTYTDDDAEARAGADACWRVFTRGVPWHAMAVLVRTNAQTGAFTNALARRGVPARTATTGRFSERPEVRSLLDELRAAERDAPGRAFEALL